MNLEGVPQSCNIIRLGAARIREINDIVNKFAHCEHGGRAYQNLPRHMQRRTISRNSQRLPRYLQQRHLREIGDNVKNTKRPKKKYRHRPYNLLSEYNRRQLDNLWLETHVWHAKRFHMTRKWGYALPLSPTTKGYRSTMRAAIKTCTVQDISYMCCIELEGTKSSLLSGFSPLVHPSELLKLENPHIIQGRKWMRLNLFRPNRQPYEAVASVDIIFHPKPKGHKNIQDTDILNLWIWVHPSAHSDVIEILTGSYNLQERDKKLCGSEDDQEKLQASETGENCSPMEEDPLKEEVDRPTLISNGDARNDLDKEKMGIKKKYVNEAKLAKKNIPSYKTPKYVSLDSGVQMTLLKDTINRFELTGPLAYTVLRSALIPASIAALSQKDTQGNQWWKSYYKTESTQSVYSQQMNAWNSLSESPPYILVPLVIRDPRMSLPYKKLPLEKVMPDGKKLEQSDWPTESPFFSSKVRNAVTQAKEADSVINEKRSKMLVPGERILEESDEAKVPVLLMSRPACHAAGHGAGWDIFIPAGWAVNVWLSLIFCGGVAVGQDEGFNVMMEALTPLPPYLQPDTSAAKRHSVSEEQERRKEYFNKPPSQRLNLLKMHVQYPFSSPWRRLVTDWKPEFQEFFVLRDITSLTEIATLCGDASRRIKAMSHRNKRKSATPSESVPSKALKKNSDTEIAENPSTVISDVSPTIEVNAILKKLQDMNTGCLVMVRLEVEGKGTIEANAMISMPEMEDLKERISSRKPMEQLIIEEPLHEDPKKLEREQLQNEHCKIGRRLRRLRKKARKAIENSTDVNTFQAKTEKVVSQDLTDIYKQIQEDNKDIVDKYSKYQNTMEEAWLMSEEEPLQCCSKKIIGYTLYGGFFHSMSYSCGVGWVCLEPLVQLLALHMEFISKMKNDAEFSDVIEEKHPTLQPLVLVRSPSALHYRWARLTVALPQE